MLVTTTPNVEGHRITHYLGIVSGETILGANIFRDISASITDIIGGRSAAYEKSLIEAKNIALREMMEQAAGLGANAIVGLRKTHAHYDQPGSQWRVSRVIYSGTAAVVA